MVIRSLESEGAALGQLHHANIDVAREHKALGWKVNGAGGHGGSEPVLCNQDRSAQKALIREVLQQSQKYRLIPITLAATGETTLAEENPQ